MSSSIQLTKDEARYTGSYGYEAAIAIRAMKLNQILIDNNDIAISTRTLVLRYTENHGSLVGGGIKVASILHHLQDFQSNILRDLASDTQAQALFRSRHLTRLDLCNISDFPLILITVHQVYQSPKSSPFKDSIFCKIPSFFLFKISAIIELFVAEKRA